MNFINDIVQFDNKQLLKQSIGNNNKVRILYQPSRLKRGNRAASYLTLTEIDVDSNHSDSEEIAGWEVEIFWERNPIDTNGIPVPYLVTSDPLDNDTENDKVVDGRERAELADPTKDDTDGDTFNDDVEYKYGSTLSGKESGIPCMIKTIDPSTKWKDRYWKRVWVGWKLVSYIDVDVLGSDPAGIKDIYVEVSSSNRLSSKEKSKTIVGNDFEHEFKFDFKLDSMITEIWSGWTVRIEVEDINGNMGYQEEHIKSGIQRLIDWIVENLKIFFNALLEWIKERVKSMLNNVLNPIKEAIEGYVKGIAKAINNAYTEYQLFGTVSNENSEAMGESIFGGSFYHQLNIILLILDVITFFISPYLYIISNLVEIITELIIPIIMKALSGELGCEHELLDDRGSLDEFINSLGKWLGFASGYLALINGIFIATPGYCDAINEKIGSGNLWRKQTAPLIFLFSGIGMVICTATYIIDMLNIPADMKPIISLIFSFAGLIPVAISAIAAIQLPKEKIMDIVASAIAALSFGVSITNIFYWLYVLGKSS